MSRSEEESKGPLIGFFESLPRIQQILWVVVIGSYLVFIVVSIALLMSNILTYDPKVASLWASIVAGLATVGLVIVTIGYVAYTRRLVEVTEQSRREERVHREKMAERDINSLRKSILKEIQAMEGLHQLARNYSPGVSVYQELIPSEVYEANSSDIGLLTDDELEAIIEYYTLASIVNDLLAVQRRHDTEYGRDFFENLFYYLGFQWLFRWRELRRRTEIVAERIGDLAEVQTEAVTQLKLHLQDTPTEGFGEDGIIDFGDNQFGESVPNFSKTPNCRSSSTYAPCVQHAL